MTIRKSNPYLSLVNSYLIDSPQPSSINYWWNLGSLLGLCLVIQIASGIFLAMHYSSHIELAFDSVEHIMRDVNAGWAIRYAHANGASFFFICLYLHIGKALYYGSYKAPRTMVWNIGIIIFVLTMATAFMGYCLVYGQMSHWGKPSHLSLLPQMLLFIIFCYNIYLPSFIIIINNLFFYKFSILLNINILHKLSNLFKNTIINLSKHIYKINNNINKRKDVTNFNEPLNKYIIEIIYGSLLGDASAEKRNNSKGTRILFYQEGSHSDYLYYLHSLIANLGYCNSNLPKIYTRLGKKGKLRKVIKFNTWTYYQFNDIFNNWYLPSYIKDINGNNIFNRYIKIVPKNIDLYLTPLSLAIWIMDDGGKVNNSIKLATNNFSYNDILYLVYILFHKFNIKSTIHKTGKANQYNIYILNESMPILVNLVKPYIIPSMKYKFGKYI